jgi:hypothetical protein
MTHTVRQATKRMATSGVRWVGGRFYQRTGGRASLTVRRTPPSLVGSSLRSERAAPNTDTERKKAPGTQAVKVKPAVVSVWRVLQIFGVICLTIVVLTHVAETLHLFPGMGWGQPTSIGHYLDLVSAILGCALLLLGSLDRAFTRRNEGQDY